MPKKILVTSALPYVNNVPHLGNLVCVISADVYARFLRLRGKNVISVCGTDEHGTTTEAKALQEGVTPKEICDKYFEVHKAIYTWFNCDFDCFGRTSSEDNKEVTVRIFKKLQENGRIIEKPVEQAFCSKCDKFLADRFVGGICPHCAYKEARGDQCESCGKLLDAPELLNPKCTVCGTKPEIKTSNHLFMDLPGIKDDLELWIHSVEGFWSVNARTMTQAWMREGLKPRCITRDLKWGIPVPGHEKKVFYSWFDAPIGYIGITKETRDDWESWWKGPEDTHLVQFMGKDNIPFHTILFPAFLLGTNEPWTLVTELSVNEYLNYAGGMFSKSRGVGVFGNDAMKTGIPSDIWRYYLMINRPEKSDTEFTWEDFQIKLNNELVANLGNLVYRVTSFVHKYLGCEMECSALAKSDKEFLDKAAQACSNITLLLEQIRLKDALKEIMHLSKLGNQYFQEQEPWSVIKEDRKRAETIMAVLSNLVKDISILIAPYMPNASASIQEQIGVGGLVWKDLGKFIFDKQRTFSGECLLFDKLEDITEFKNRFDPKPSCKLQLRVGKVESVQDHPDADKLYVLRVNLGRETRQIVAGLKSYYTKEELMGKHIIVVANLETAMLRGQKSEGMILAGDDGNVVRLIGAPNSPPGTPALFEGYEEKQKQITFKDFQKLNLTVRNHNVVFGGKALRTEKEAPHVPISDGAKVR